MMNMKKKNQTQTPKPALLFGKYGIPWVVVYGTAFLWVDCQYVFHIGGGGGGRIQTQGEGLILTSSFCYDFCFEAMQWQTVGTGV